MLIEYIERMRKQPPAVRRRAVVYWTLSIMVVIVILYIVYWTMRGTVLAPQNGDGRTQNIAAPYESAQ